MSEATKCKVEGCKRPYRSKGYCTVHFNKWRKGEMTKKPRYKICGEENCKKPMYMRGQCQAHYEAWLQSRKQAAEGPKVEGQAPATPAAEAK
jgi:hypothetical protein